MTRAPHLLPEVARGLQVRRHDAGRLDGLRRALRPVHRAGDDQPDRHLQRVGRPVDPRGAGRLLGPLPPARRRGVEERASSTTRSCRSTSSRRRGDITVSQDEGVRGDTTVESLSAAPPGRQGRHDHRRLGLPDLRRSRRSGGDEQGEGRRARADLARRDRRVRPGRRARLDAPAPAGPTPSRRRRPRRASRSADIDLFELNEAFAAVGIESARQLGVGEDVVNVNGGAIALGHPVGMSGARIVLHLALELRRRGGGIGAAALCGGGGQGDALIIRVPPVAEELDRGRTGRADPPATGVPELVVAGARGRGPRRGAADLAGRGRVTRSCGR